MSYHSLTVSNSLCELTLVLQETFQHPITFSLSTFQRGICMIGLPRDQIAIKHPHCLFVFVFVLLPPSFASPQSSFYFLSFQQNKQSCCLLCVPPLSSSISLNKCVCFARSQQERLNVASGKFRSFSQDQISVQIRKWETEKFCLLWRKGRKCRIWMSCNGLVLHENTVEKNI